jgi:hypothetical protein
MSLPMQLEIVDGPAAGGWVGAELSGPAGSVSAQVPARYEAYVRILHPPHDPTGKRVTWATVAQELDRTSHPLAQWDAIVGANRYRNERPAWPGREPETGSLEKDLLAALLETLSEHTGAPEKSFFGVWIGMSWGTTYAIPAGSDQPLPEDEFRATDDLSFAFPVEQVARPRLVLPGREYVVIAGRLEAAILIEGWLSPSSPNLIWPEDRAWFVASEIDFDSTLVGGSEKLARWILEDRRLEAFPVDPRDLLTWNADKVNPPPPR